MGIIPAKTISRAVYSEIVLKPNMTSSAARFFTADEWISRSNRFIFQNFDENNSCQDDLQSCVLCDRSEA